MAAALLVDGADSLRIGNLRLTKTGIESIITGQDITIGNLNDRGLLSVANGIRFPDGTVQSSAILQGLKGDTGAQGPSGPQGAQGPAGAQGVQGPAGPQGIAGSAGGVGGSGACGPQGIARNSRNDECLLWKFLFNCDTQTKCRGSCDSRCGKCIHF
jgi:hypothetical protein